VGVPLRRKDHAPSSIARSARVAHRALRSGPAQQKETKPRQVTQYDARTFFDTTGISGPSFSPDESRILFSSDASGVFNAYTVPIAGGKPDAKTSSTTHSIFAQSCFPARRSHPLHRGPGGNELDHVYVLMPDATVKDLDARRQAQGGVRRVDPGSARRSSSPATSATTSTSTSIATRATASRASWPSRTPRASRPATSAATDVTSRSARPTTTPTRRLPVRHAGPDQKPKLVTPHQGKATHTPATFSPDGTKLYYSTNAHSEFQQIWSYDLKSGKHEPAIQADWDVMFVAFSEKGRYRVSGINEDARTVIHVLDTTTGKEVKLPDLPRRTSPGVRRFRRAEKKMAFLVNGDTSPVEPVRARPRQRTAHAAHADAEPGDQEDDLVVANVIRYKSYDGLEIPALLYRPWCASPTAKVPAIVSVHGGPADRAAAATTRTRSTS
jgi:dipeptidyl aminopeptidase/acylaminoacyl peptidase